MNKRYISLQIVALVTIIVLTSCKKTVPNIFNMFDVTLDLHQNSPYSLLENQDLNEGDSIYFDFTITSPTKEMAQVAFFQMGSALPVFRINMTDANRHSYTGIVKAIAGQNGNITSAMIPGANGQSLGNLRTGVNTFRIWAYDKQGIYIGDGYKTITINVNNKMTQFVNRKLYFPDVDSANGSRNSYLSLTTGETFNYQDGAANSAKIDLGIFRTVIRNANGDTTGWNARLYSPSASPLPYLANNISSWTKTTTKFANGQAGQTLRGSYGTAAILNSYAKGRNPNLATLTSSLAVGQGVAFLLPNGKYGVIVINQLSHGRNPFMDVSWRYEL